VTATLAARAPFADARPAARRTDGQDAPRHGWTGSPQTWDDGYGREREPVRELTPPGYVDVWRLDKSISSAVIDERGASVAG
jgi:ribosomal protein L32E